MLWVRLHAIHWLQRWESLKEYCWLKDAMFSASDTYVQNFVVDAATLSPDFVAGLSNDCKIL